MQKQSACSYTFFFLLVLLAGCGESEPSSDGYLIDIAACASDAEATEQNDKTDYVTKEQVEYVYSHTDAKPRLAQSFSVEETKGFWGIQVRLVGDSGFTGKAAFTVVHNTEEPSANGATVDRPSHDQIAEESIEYQNIPTTVGWITHPFRSSIRLHRDRKYWVTFAGSQWHDSTKRVAWSHRPGSGMQKYDVVTESWSDVTTDDGTGRLEARTAAFRLIGCRP